ncbi:hypothetical protein K2173_012815 [Erythroxylum novogranatense]|uniref:Uncharacterized protein n=1 Tax=Erythroxylum novogranatense TaxID=1862640 RepID=A0AAV8S639_9ROSI|nr:hypothetical protein K2173_012815 [Erythroxylum novogranatense]
MGNCAVHQNTRRIDGGGCLNTSLTAKVIHIDGELEEFKQPLKASFVLSQNPTCFLCSSESMDINCHLPPVPNDEALQLGQIYFLIPLAKFHARLSLQELCVLAIKANAALADHHQSHVMVCPLNAKSSFSWKNASKFHEGNHRYSSIQINLTLLMSIFRRGIAISNRSRLQV